MRIGFHLFVQQTVIRHLKVTDRTLSLRDAGESVGLPVFWKHHGWWGREMVHPDPCHMGFEGPGRGKDCMGVSKGHHSLGI